MRFAVIAWLGVALVGCQCEPGGTPLIYLCKADAECVDGYVCGKVSRTCIKTGTIEGDAGMGGGAGGGGGGGEGGGGEGGGVGGGGVGGGGVGGGGIGGGVGGGGVGGGGVGGGGVGGGGVGGGGVGGGGVGGGGVGGGGVGGGGVGGGGVGGGGVGGGGAALPPTSLVFITAVPTPLLAGACVLTTVQAQRATVPTAVAANTTVGLSEVAVGTARYYSDVNCTTSITTTTILAGQTNANFYLKPITGGMTSQTAAAPFGSAQRTLTIVGAVRRGTCSFNAPTALPDGGQTEDLFASCGIPGSQQSIGRTALFFQATTASGSAGTLGVRCRLTATDTITCNRSGGSSAGTIHWQTVELPTGLRVERVTGACTGTSFTATLPAAVNPATSFVLKSYQTGSGSLDDDDLIAARLTSSTTIGLDIGEAGVSCSGGSFEAQAVELSGLTVTRDIEDGGMPAGTATRTDLGLSATSVNTALLTQHTVPSSSDPVCDMLVRAEMLSSSSISFSRTAGSIDPTCTSTPVLRLFWERLDFGTRAVVQAKTVTLPPGTSTLPVPISAVDTTRTIVFASSQAASGQGVGETNYAGGSAYLAEGHARFELSSSTAVTVVRQRSSSTALFTFYVVELNP